MEIRKRQLAQTKVHVITIIPCSANLVNILYGSVVPLLVRSSTRTPMYASPRSIAKACSPLEDKDALIPARIP